MTDIIVILFFIILLLFILFEKKIDDYLAPYIEKYFEVTMLYGIIVPIYLFGMLFSLRSKMVEDNPDPEKYYYLIFVCVVLVITIIWDLIRKFYAYISNQTSFVRFVVYILITLFSVVMCFGFVYNILYLLNSNVFSNVVEVDYWGQAKDFIFYSYEIFFGTDLSEIKAVSIMSKSFVILESLSSFLLLFILIANIELIGKLYRKMKS